MTDPSIPLTCGEAVSATYVGTTVEAAPEQRPVRIRPARTAGTDSAATRARKESEKEAERKSMVGRRPKRRIRCPLLRPDKKRLFVIKNGGEITSVQHFFITSKQCPQRHKGADHAGVLIRDGKPTYSWTFFLSYSDKYFLIV